MSEPLTAAELREALGAEYGHFVAAVAIDLQGARAFNVGDAVPRSHVERGVVTTEQVQSLTTKAGKSIVQNPEK